MMAEHTIAARYVIQAELGAGSMGTVYRGLDTQTNALVAIKQLRSDLTDDALIERFRREGEALRALNHPNIVKMLAAIEEGDRHYLVMEYVSGGDLGQLMQAKGKLDYQRCVNMAIDLADALTRAHRLNIVHRDLKPGNVLIGDGGTLRLTDFGVAHIGSKTRVTEPDAILGTIVYMPPEALTDGIYDPSGDIWALGVMLFEMLVGQLPFNGTAIGKIIEAVTTAPVPDLEVLCPDMPAALVDLIYRMLEKDPAARIRSVRQVGLELEDLMAGRSNTTNARFTVSTSTLVHARQPKLPSQITPFVGREVELYELEKMLLNPQLRLITLLAPGGMGKSRLALELASRLAGSTHPDFANGVYFAELAPLSSPDDIPSAIAAAVGFQFRDGTGTPRQQILNYLANKNALLILDNFEHLLTGIDLVRDVLESAPDVTMLATSRERLNLIGEQLFTIGGMDFPDWEMPEDALNFAAAKLFVQSAKRIQPHFELTAPDLTHLAHVCRLVEGMPLAIVLAAAWVETLSVEEIAAELTAGLDLLGTELHDIPARQRSIQTVFEYSWQRLSEKEREAFAGMAVFQGGATRQAVQEITGTTLRLLQGLVNKGLLRREPNSGRYLIHELARQYARARLDEMGQTDPMRAAHSRYYLDSLAHYTADLKGRNQFEVASTIESDFENVRSAWNWAAQHREFDLLENASESLLLFCDFRGRRTDGIAFLQTARAAIIPRPGEEPHPAWWHTVARHETTLMAAGQGHAESAAHIEAALHLAHEHNDLEGIKLGLLAQVRLHIVSRDLQAAIEKLQTALPICQRLEDTYWTARINYLLGYCYLSLGQQEQALQTTQQSLVLAQAMGNKILEAQVLNNLGAIAATSAEAEKLVRQANVLYREIGHRRGTAWTNLNLAQFALARGEIEEGHRLAQQAIVITNDINEREPHGFALCTLGDVARMKGNYAKAHKLYAQSEPLLISNPTTLPNVYIGWSLTDCGLGDYQAARVHCYQALELSAKVQVLPLIVSCFPAAALILAQRGHAKHAAELLALTYHLSEYSTGWLDAMILINQLHQTLQNTLGAEVYAAAAQSGTALDVDQVVQELLATLRADSQ